MQKKVFSASLALLVLSSSVAQAFQYEKNVPEEHSRLLEMDLRQFDKMNFDHADTQRRRKLFELRHAPNTSSLRSWLEERAKIIVPQEWDPNQDVIAKRSGIYAGVPKKPVLSTPSHPTPEQSPKESPEEKPKSTAVVVMANYGAAIYQFSKHNGLVYTFALDGLSKFEITSPRVGLLQIGEGLFHPHLAINSENSESLANSMNRLSTLFHEARHSDGHGKSLAFSHALCPPGHGYQGLPACDQNLNGPYTIGAEIKKMMLANCSTCTSTEKEMIRLRALDSLSRVLTTYDDLPSAGEVEISRITSGNCLLFAKMMPTLSNECRNELMKMYRILKKGVVSRMATDLDPTPEKAVQ